MVNGQDIRTVISTVLVQLGFVLQENQNPARKTPEPSPIKSIFEVKTLWSEEKAEVQACLHNM